jgi:CheY-like chemotaxis protein
MVNGIVSIRRTGKKIGTTRSDHRRMRGMAKILIIDDVPGLRRTVHGMLRHGGHEVFEAGDGSEGIRMFEAYRPDVVITDLVMPGKEGIETILDLRRRSRPCRSSPFLAIPNRKPAWTSPASLAPMP